MEKIFTQHFQGTYKRPNTYTDLTRCVQKLNEIATQFLARWIQTKASCENVDDKQAIHAFIHGLLKGKSLRHKLVRMQFKDLGVMLKIAAMYAKVDNEACDGVDLALARRTSAKKKAPQDAGASNEVAAAFEGKGSNRKWKANGKDAALAKTRMTYKHVKNQPCAIHASLGKVNHTFGEGCFMDDIKKDPEVGWKSKKSKKSEKARKEDDKRAVSMLEDEDPKPPRK